MTKRRAGSFGFRRPARRREYATGLRPVNGSVAGPDAFVLQAGCTAQLLRPGSDSGQAAHATATGLSHSLASCSRIARMAIGRRSCIPVSATYPAWLLDDVEWRGCHVDLDHGRNQGNRACDRTRLCRARCRRVSQLSRRRRGGARGPVSGRLERRALSSDQAGRRHARGRPRRARPGGGEGRPAGPARALRRPRHPQARCSTAMRTISPQPSTSTARRCSTSCRRPIRCSSAAARCSSSPAGAGAPWFPTMPPSASARHWRNQWCAISRASSRRRGIRINSVAPGVVHTDAVRALFGDQADEIVQHAAETNPSGRGVRDEDYTGVIRFLASPEAAFVRGRPSSSTAATTWPRERRLQPSRSISVALAMPPLSHMV